MNSEEPIRTPISGDLRIRTLNVHDDGQFVDCDFQLWHCTERENKRVEWSFVAKFSDLWDLMDYAQMEFPYSHIFEDEQLISYPMEDKEEQL